MPSPAIESALNQMSADHIMELAARAASYWRSVGDAAFRGDLTTMEVHCQQIAAVSKEAFRTVQELRASTKVDA